MTRNHWLLLCERVDCIGQLNLTVQSVWRLLESLKYLWAQHVASDNGEVRWSVRSVWLLNNAAERNCAPLVAGRKCGVGVNDAVAVRICWRNAHHAEYRCLRSGIRRNELGECGSGTEDKIVGKHHRKWLMPNGVLRHEDGVTKSKLLFLTDCHKVHHVGNGAHRAKVFNVAALFQDRLKVSGDIKVVLNGALVFARNKNDALNPRSDRLFNGVLNRGAINDRQQLFRDGLGRRKEPGAPSGNRENCGADLHRGLRAVLVHRIPVTPRGEPTAGVRGPACRRAGAAHRFRLQRSPGSRRAEGVLRSAFPPGSPL